MINVREAALQYLARGWQIVPLEPKGKKCIHNDWMTRTYGADDIPLDHNIGIKSFSGIVDIDCDCPEAVTMAEAFLPKTQAVYGRHSRPRSHWLFRSDIEAPSAFKDLVEKKTLIEIRIKHQSMAPPSIHPEGETVEWDNPAFLLSTDMLKEMQVDKALLTRAVQLCATGAMIARYYNPPGARHDWGVALAGFLRRLNITQHEAERLFDRAGKWVRDDKIKDRFDAVRTTYSVSEETPTTGAKRLEELIGDQGKDFVATLYKIWGGEGGGVSKTRLDAMNAKHAVLFNQGGKVIVMTEMQEDDQLQIRFTSRADFDTLYPQKVQTGVTSGGKPIFNTLAKAWIEHPKRRFYNGIELAPNGKCNDGYYNLWQGFTFAPKKGDWSLFWTHINLLTEGNADHARYILSWMAETVQHPEKPIGIALAFKGGQGVGKSTFATWFGALFGSHFLHLDSEHRLLGQFNAHLHNAIVVLADEAVWAGGKQGLGALKRMITEKSLAIERKGLDVINVKNMLHMIIASNEDWFVPTGFDNRRFAIFKASDAQQNNAKFFGAVHDQLFLQGGLAALLYDLMEYKTEINLRDIPDTDELQEQKKWSMGAKHAWWHEQLMSGAPWQGATELPPDGSGETYYEIDPEPLYSAYVAAIRIGDIRANPGFMGAVGRFMRTVMPDGCPTHVSHENKRYWVIPSLEKCRRFFDQVTRGKSQWPQDAALNAPNIPF